MPTDPNARGNSLLSDILGELKKTNKLLEAQNKISEKMEKHARPTVVGQRNPYLDRSVPDGGDDHVGPYGTGTSQPYT